MRRPRDDSGYVALMTAILLPVLIGMTALAVDVSAWYLSVHKQQKAADAGALAGAIYLPGKFEQAKAVALDTVKANGFDPADDGTTVSITLGARPTQLRVSITQEVTNFFGSVLGIGASDFTRDGVSDFAGPLAMGSPCNVLGNEDMEPDVSGALQVGSPACTDNAQYWVNMAGGSVNKARGDAVGSFWCRKPDSGQSGIDGCQTSTGALASNVGLFPGVCNAEAGLTNCVANPKPQGYFYTVHVGNSPPADLRVQIYDAAFVMTGDNCDDGTANLASIAGSVTNYYVTSAAESTKRYSGNSPRSTTGNKFCTGDQLNTGEEGDGTTTKTVYTLYRPSPSASDPLAGGRICSTTVDGYGSTEFASRTLKARLGDPGAGNLLAKYFHRWSDLCEGVNLTGLVADGNYVVQVQTYGPNGQPGGGGQNRFALRAFTGDGRNASANGAFNIAALQHESLYYNFKPDGGASKFNLVRLPTGSGGHTLAIRLFDIGDGSAVKVEFNPPGNSTLGSTAWDAGVCTAEAMGVNDPVPGCVVDAYLSKNGGRWETIRIPVPDTYRCNADADASKCWVTATLTAAYLNDTTTWEASLDGDPVRLVPDP